MVVIILIVIAILFVLFLWKGRRSTVAVCGPPQQYVPYIMTTGIDHWSADSIDAT